MSAAPRLSVIIVSYNSRADLERLLPALRAQSLPHEVIVVDNASRDGTPDVLRERFPEVRLIEPGENLYFCRGNNLGLDAACAGYALLLNPDTLPPPDALHALVAFMDAHPDYAGVTAQLRYPDGGIQRTCSRIPSYRYLLLSQTVLRFVLRGPLRRAEAHHWYTAEGWARDRDRDVEAAPGSCILMRRADLRLNPALQLYFNEDDLARRFAGRRFRFLASVRIEHREKSVTRSASASRLYFRDLIVYTRQHHGAARAALLWLAALPLAWAIALRWRLRGG